MNHFEVRDEEMFCEDVPLARIAREVGTPAYVYSLATLERHFRVFDEAFADRPHVVCFSVKACPNLAILRALARLGSGFDVVSGGELRRALLAKADPQKIVFSGVGKREEEIRLALRSGILMINVESLGELSMISRVAKDEGTHAPIALRINPDVDAETHPYISTGLRKNKFGIPAGQARLAYDVARSLSNLEIVGIDCHIGSQLTKVAPFRDAIAKIAELARSIALSGTSLRYLDVGGGLGIPYAESEPPPSPAEYAVAITEAIEPFSGLGLKLIFEPGRVIVGNAGVLLTEVLFFKRNEEKNFVVVDAGFNDLLRPAFYDSYHAIRPIRKPRGGAERVTVDVVGPICETGDFLARDREIEEPQSGDILAVMSAGAYGFSMASNYNTRGRAPEVLVSRDQFEVIRARETFDDLVRGERIPEFLEGPSG